MMLSEVVGTSQMDGEGAVEPFVSIVTPVFNGERYLRACIDSVLAQEHQNWEYIINNNCSTDGTLSIAESYASRDKRIRVNCNTDFVNADANHNIAFRQISPRSKYCKVVSADDWLEPHCVRRLVEAAEANPSVGLVGSYQRSGSTIRWMGLPPQVTYMAGRDIARRSLRCEIDVLGTPTSVLYRADLVRKREDFFPHTRPHADTSACYEVFKDADFAFVHELLSHERVHEGQVSSAAIELSAGVPAYIEILQTYGPTFLGPVEFKALEAQSIQGYYRWLGGCVLKLKGKRFWSFHTRRLTELGLSVDRTRIAVEAVKEAWTELQQPAEGMRKCAQALRALRRG